MQALTCKWRMWGSNLTCDLNVVWLPRSCQLQRLKEKMGDRSNASSEVEYHGAHGRLLGEEGRGVKCIIEMVGLTRLDCTLGSAALMRHALSQALHHTKVCHWLWGKISCRVVPHLREILVMRSRLQRSVSTSPDATGAMPCMCHVQLQSCVTGRNEVPSVLCWQISQ